MRGQHQPTRTCLGCNSRDDQSALMRLVARVNGELELDSHGPGRGGYLHRSEKCWEAFLRRKSLYRAFHLDIGRAAREKLIKTICS